MQNDQKIAFKKIQNNQNLYIFKIIVVIFKIPYTDEISKIRALPQCVKHQATPFQNPIFSNAILREENSIQFPP